MILGYNWHSQNKKTKPKAKSSSNKPLSNSSSDQVYHSSDSNYDHSSPCDSHSTAFDGGPYGDGCDPAVT